MKQNTLLKAGRDEEKCQEISCRKCQSCKVISMEEKREEQKSNSLQLYAKEAEHYFFYYAVNMKQA
jgi:hypothetical protein